jgi:hypothetical protein
MPFSLGMPNMLRACLKVTVTLKNLLLASVPQTHFAIILHILSMQKVALYNSFISLIYDSTQWQS